MKTNEEKVTEIEKATLREMVLLSKGAERERASFWESLRKRLKKQDEQ